MMGWRKLSAWGLLFALTAAALWMQKDIPANAKDLLWGATMFFFGANTLGKFAAAKGSKEPS